MLELVTVTVLGTLIGVLTGFIPGLHPNTVVFSTFPAYFSLDISFPVYICFVAGLSVCHTFHDFLPAIYLSAPSAESAVASLPGTEMARNGKGKTAFFYTVYGGLVAVCSVLIVSPLLFIFLEPIYQIAAKLMPFILIFFLAFILISRGGLSGVLVASASGILGVLAFRQPVNQSFVLMPVFSGLFAVPAVLEAWRSELDIVEQEGSEANVSVRGGVIGFISGLLAGTVPGVGAGVATSFLSPFIEDRKEVLTGLGAVNTSDIFVSLIALFLIEKARSGASVAIRTLGELTPELMVLTAGSSFLAVGISVSIASYTQELFLSVVRRFQLGKVLAAVLVLICVLTLYFTGLIGLLILSTSSAIGLLAWDLDCRICGMAVLIVPALLFYLNIGIFI